MTWAKGSCHVEVVPRDDSQAATNACGSLGLMRIFRLVVSTSTRSEYFALVTYARNSPNIRFQKKPCPANSPPLPNTRAPIHIFHGFGCSMRAHRTTGSNCLLCTCEYTVRR